MDALENSHPVEVEVGNPGEIGEIFDAISYNKGASVIRMLAGYLGQDVFQRALNQYLNKHLYKNAVTQVLALSLFRFALTFAYIRICGTQ